jgi:hypothetical protein
VSGLRISPEPTEEEAVAIAAAIEVTRPVAVLVDEAERESRWRFSGRWWSRPVAARRSRPGV